MSRPGVIDGLQFARAGQEVRGELGMEDLPRLAEMQGRTEGVEFSVRGGTRHDNKPWLRILVSGDLELACQRCLEPLDFRLEVDSELELTEDAREIDAAEDDTDRVLATKAMDVRDLVEDEILLALPMIARHEGCAPAQAAGDEPSSSPFGALEALRRARG